MYFCYRICVLPGYFQPGLFPLAGVSAVEADVEAKKVMVTSNGATTKQAMLDALLKWSSASGKSVELASD